MTKHPTLRIVAILGVAIAVTAGVLLRKYDHGAFAQTTSITFIQDLPGRLSVPGVEAANAPKQLKLAVTNPAEVRRFISTIRLEKKEACWCLHNHTAIFETPTKQIEVSFCPHCFDVVENGSARDYRMPESFLNELSKEIKAQGQAGWLLPPP